MNNGRKVSIRESKVEDTETLFLARNLGEFQTSVESERDVIEAVNKDKDISWFVAEYEDKVLGQCSVCLV